MGSPTIDLKKLEHTIKSHGILLEHRTKSVLNESFHSLKFEVLESTVSRSLREAANEHNSLELDVSVTAFTKAEYFKKLSLTVPCSYWEMEEDENHQIVTGPVRIDTAKRNENITVSIIAECKGHDKSGFLLVRRSPTPEHYRILVFDPHNGQYGVWGYLEKKCDCFSADWGYFYKDGFHSSTPGRPPSYKQDKEGNINKFQKGIGQLRQAIKVITHETLMTNSELPTPLSFLIPMLVTNVPIISFDANGRIYEDIPWMTYAMNESCFTRRDPTTFSHLLLVNVEYIGQLVESLIPMGTSLSYPIEINPRGENLDLS